MQSVVYHFVATEAVFNDLRSATAVASDVGVMSDIPDIGSILNCFFLRLAENVTKTKTSQRLYKRNI